MLFPVLPYQAAIVVHALSGLALKRLHEHFVSSRACLKRLREWLLPISPFDYGSGFPSSIASLRAVSRR